MIGEMQNPRSYNEFVDNTKIDAWNVTPEEVLKMYTDALRRYRKIVNRDTPLPEQQESLTPVAENDTEAGAVTVLHVAEVADYAAADEHAELG